MGITTSLRQALKRILYPHVREVGFTVDTADQPQSTTFRRITGDVLDVFDIQWDDHAKPRFVINFAQATSPQTDPYGNVIPLEKLRAYQCEERLRLQRRRGGSFGCWFQLRRPLVEQLVTFKRENNADEVVLQVIEYFPEMEAWWRTREVGPHVQSL